MSGPWSAWAVRWAQGRQFVRDLRGARPEGYRGRPVIAATPCEAGCTACVDACPTAALSVAGGAVRLDLGRCVFCAECEAVCPAHKLSFTNDPRMAARERGALVLGEGSGPPAVAVEARIRSLFGRSLRLRQISAGGCNACELELNATANVNFDLQRFGIEWVASPRHADGLVLTGPLTRNMARAVQLCVDATPEPKFLVAVGACAISGGLYAEGDVDRALLDRWPPLVQVPGCPVHPLTFAHAILDLLGR